MPKNYQILKKYQILDLGILRVEQHDGSERGLVSQRTAFGIRVHAISRRADMHRVKVNLILTFVIEYVSLKVLQIFRFYCDLVGGELYSPMSDDEIDKVHQRIRFIEKGLALRKSLFPNPYKTHNEFYGHGNKLKICYSFENLSAA